MPIHNFDDLINKYDDLKVISNNLSDCKGFTLTGIICNEMYFLPSFLAYYRRLGVERFVFIGDHSIDGTREYLARQDDVMVLGSSNSRYSDQIDIPLSVDGSLMNIRIALFWRTLLLSKFACDGWSLQVDADEFICLPDKMSFHDMIPELERNGAEAVWGVMLDMYPANIVDLQAQKKATTFDPDAPWYFDGQEHLRVRSQEAPKHIYSGATARLMAQLGLSKKLNIFKSIVFRLSKSLAPIYIQHPKYIEMKKPVLLKWSKDKVLLTGHDINFHATPSFLLPIKHFKFTGDLYKRVTDSIAKGSHFDNSIKYRDVQRLLEKMEKEGTSFLYSRSMEASDFSHFQRTGNAVGFE